MLYYNCAFFAYDSVTTYTIKLVVRHQLMTSALSWYNGVIMSNCSCSLACATPSGVERLLCITTTTYTWTTSSGILQAHAVPHWTPKQCCPINNNPVTLWQYPNPISTYHELALYDCFKLGCSYILHQW